MPTHSPRERVAVIRALLAAVEAELDQIDQAITRATSPNFDPDEHNWPNVECPDCGQLWGEASPTCPRTLTNRHPKV